MAIEISVSRHAFNRYRERVDGQAIERDVIEAVNRSTVLGRGSFKLVQNLCPGHAHLVNYNSGFIYRRKGQVIFVLRTVGIAKYKLVTCLRIP
jgi:hypothetical protein